MRDDPSNSKTGSARLTLLIRVGWLCYWVALFCIMHTPRPPGLFVVERIGDKVAHGLAYCLLALLGGWVAFRTLPAIGWRWAIRWFGVYGAYAAMDEWLQSFVGRRAEVGDWVADMSGVIVGLVTMVVLSRLSSVPRV